jgi:hypothetical protein
LPAGIGALEGGGVTRSAELGTRSGPLADASARAALGSTAATHQRSRGALAWIFGIAGLVAYNWWLLVPLKPGLMTSPDELFSNLEVSGQPYAAAMQHADLAAGLLLLAALWAAGHNPSATGRREWLSMLAFAAAGALGGLFPEVCADGINAVCRRLEYRFELPANQYIHVAAGILEFAGVTLALLWAWRRTRGQSTRPAAVYRALGIGALIAYPLLGAAYLFDRLGGIMEAVFFIGFTVMVIAQLADRTAAARVAARAVAPMRQYSRV